MKHRIKQWLRARRARQVTYVNAQERVARGARFLDERDPGWYQRVNPVTLELADGQSCVLGQLHGDFRLGLSRSLLLNFSSAPRASLSPVSHGFKCVSGVAEAVQDKDYELLNRAWRAAVRERRASDSAVAPAGAVEHGQAVGQPGGAVLAADRSPRPAQPRGAADMPQQA